MKKIFTIICLFLVLIFLFTVGLSQACNMCNKLEEVHNGVLFAGIDANRVILSICRVEDVSFSENYGVTLIKSIFPGLSVKSVEDPFEMIPCNNCRGQVDGDIIKPGEEMKQVNLRLGKKPTSAAPYCGVNLAPKPGGKPTKIMMVKCNYDCIKAYNIVNRGYNLVYKSPMNSEFVLLTELGRMNIS